MPRIDIELVKRKAELLDKDLVRLKKYHGINFEEYLENQETQLVVERLLEKITGRLIDINYHILKEEYEVMPEDYYSSFIEMGKNKIISEEFATEIAKVAGLRNALAHEYEEIDNQKVYDSIEMALTQVPQYLQKILDFLS